MNKLNAHWIMLYEAQVHVLIYAKLCVIIKYELF